ncbi:hypothetical protein JAAARDRAFT_212082 [Jaapia argillacea MUCL 33604]|uniref:Uncharacterized protein n=1 Tax=Jaapia argillacea MUCL 33604 TaxID=933084 RepID=A0A067P796_9AGAM|nr:hypothetical protein JAAARDRAFT_212082 [Jaapia argillacea MUCL 33604]
MAWDRRNDSRLIPSFEGELAAYLTLAFECDIKIILPALYYSACKAPLVDTLTALNSVHRATNKDIYTSFFLGRDRLRHAESQCSLSFLFCRFYCPGSQCDVEERMRSARSEALQRSTARGSGEGETYVDWCVARTNLIGAHHEFCPACCKFIEGTFEDGRKVVWRELPEFFGLPGWEALKKEALDDPSIVK